MSRTIIVVLGALRDFLRGFLGLAGPASSRDLEERARDRIRCC